MTQENKTTEPSETVKRLRETFAALAAKLKPEDEPAIVYLPACTPVTHDRS